MIRHITELPAVISTFDKKPWVVLGKGPSIEKLKESDALDLSHKYNIWAINQTIKLIGKADILSCSDYECFTDIPTGMIFNQPVYMQSTPRWRNKGESGNINTFSNHNYSLKMLMLRNELYSLDFESEERLFPDQEPFVMDISGAMAFQILGRLGVKEIFSLGLDGGNGRAEEFEGSHKIDGHSYDIHFERVKHWATFFNINWIRL
jgi:hypothetical protein